MVDYAEMQRRIRQLMAGSEPLPEHDWPGRYTAWYGERESPGVTSTGADRQ